MLQRELITNLSDGENDGGGEVKERRKRGGEARERKRRREREGQECDK